MTQYKRFFIIGHPGAGKTVLAKKLAEKMGWQFIDADFGLEIHIGRMLSEILGKEGEKSFHHCESEILDSLTLRENIVVTTDASIVCNDKNRKILSSEFTVYLKVSTPVQLERTLRNPTSLLLESDLKTFFEKLHESRNHLYDQVAHLTINGDGNALDEHVSNIINSFSQNDEVNLHNPLILDKNDFVIYHKKLHTPVHLSKQQASIVKLLSQGKSSKEIARTMSISYRTVENYIAKTMETLGCSSSKELIALYHDRP